MAKQMAAMQSGQCHDFACKCCGTVLPIGRPGIDRTCIW